MCSNGHISLSLLVARHAVVAARRIQYGSRKSPYFRSESTASGTGKHLFSSGRQRASAPSWLRRPIKRRSDKDHPSPSYLPTQLVNLLYINLVLLCYSEKRFSMLLATKLELEELCLWQVCPNPAVFISAKRNSLSYY